MTRQINESVSALFDDQAHRQDIECLIEQASDQQRGEAWDRYQRLHDLLVGSGLADQQRSQPVNLVAQIRQRIERETLADPTEGLQGGESPVAPVVSLVETSGSRLTKKPLLKPVFVKGFALAASMVLMVVLGLQFGDRENPAVGDDPVAKQTLARAESTVAVATENALNSERPASQVSREILLENYLRWHAEQASMTGPPATLPVARLASYGSGSRP